MAYKKLQFIGFTGAHIAPVCAALLQERQDTCLLVTPSFERARMVAKNLSFFTDRKILILPEDDPFFFSFQAKSRSEPNSRLEALISMHKNDGALILCPVSGAVKKMLPVVNFALDSFELRPGASFDQADLQKDLSAMGYERVSIVENKGEFAVRGGIIDLFAPDANNPFRVDFFGNEIESIRFFETESQKSIADISSYYVYPAAEFLPLPREKEAAIVSIEDSYRNAAKASNDDERDIALDTRRNSLLESIEAGTNRQLLENYITHFTENYCILSDHLPSGGAVLIDDPDRIREVMELRYQEAADDFEVLAARGQAVKKDFDGFSGPDDLNRLYRQHDVFFFTVFAGTPEGAENITEQKNLLVRQPAVMGGNMTLFLSEIKRYVKQNYEITIVCSTDERLDNLRGLLAAENVGAGVRFERGELETGTEILSDRKVWLWDGDIFRTGRKKKTAPTLKDRSPIRSFNDIRSGDFVVHESHGIGKFIGIEEKTVQGNKRDYLKIKYAGNDMLFVPIDQMSVVQKYIGGGETAPKIHKLSGMEWKNAKARARADIEGMAAELVAITAARQAGQGFAFSPDTVWQKDFEDKFPYEETDDQIRCIASIKRDMERPVPMDRLLCGDVGYGKTEVALRAVFKCVCDGKQAAVLAPTTILARQHYETFSKRFEDFPFTVEMMSRFRTKAEQMETIRGLAKGTVDVVIGTHRLLSADVAYRDLGLLVIDEEQRFGVKHKEKIKTMKSSVDVLTLTATPIPRTMHMSLIGLRDMDLIEEPPEDRYPVQTYVMEENEEIIRETIRRELDRQGQVYAVVSRISSVDRVAADIQRLVPEASVAAGHGRMNETQLENVMIDFIDRKYDVLVSTTIIESGIDIPNVNTIIIFDADRFGLSQLYQLRGRVGRTNRIAFAYLLYRKDKVVSEVAEKRLRTIREFTEFGAGFKIAMRDLEIRGAGNILGSEQHGHMVAVGYELYCKMVDDAVKALSGTEPVDAAVDVTIDLPLSAYIPESYISDESLKLQAYKKIALVESRTEKNDVAGELEDRFGQLPPQVASLIRISYARFLAGKAGIRKISTADDTGGIVLFYISGEKLRPKGIAAAYAVFGERISISGTRAPSVRITAGKLTGSPADALATLDDLILLLETLLIVA